MALTREEQKSADKLFGAETRKTMRELHTWAWRSQRIKEAALKSDVQLLSVGKGFPIRRFVVAGPPGRMAAFEYRLGD